MSLDLLTVSDQLADSIDRASSSVVQVHGRRRPASGVIYRPGLVLTTTRALGREEGLSVRDASGASHQAELAGWDPATGLVLLRAEGVDGTPFSPSVRAPRVGHVVIALGRSWSNALTATTGIVSVIGGPLPTGPGRVIERIIRTTAPMHGGFAGGALIDGEGGLVGISTAVAIRGLAVIIPSDIASTVAARLAEHGTIARGYLGLAGQAVRLAAGQGDDIDRQTALLVVAVATGSPAEAAGILVGDVILVFGEHRIQSPVDLLECLDGERIGEAVDVQLLRGGRPHTLSVVVGRKPGN